MARHMGREKLRQYFVLEVAVYKYVRVKTQLDE